MDSFAPSTHSTHSLDSLVPTSDFPLLTSHFSLRTSHFALRASRLLLLTSRFALLTSRFSFPTVLELSCPLATPSSLPPVVSFPGLAECAKRLNNNDNNNNNSNNNSPGHGPIGVLDLLQGCVWKVPRPRKVGGPGLSAAKVVGLIPPLSPPNLWQGHGAGICDGSCRRIHDPP